MRNLEQGQLKRLTAVHGWSGTILGLLLYVVVVTGTVVVFAHEMEVWSIGGTRHNQPISGKIDAKVRPVIDTVTKGYHGHISIFSNAYGDLTVFPHADVIHPETGEEEANGSHFTVDANTGEVLARRDGFVFHETDWHIDSALSDFLVGLHVRLYVPRPWGYILTGVLGLLMISTGISGVLMHRHLIRDLFVSTRPGLRLITFRDRHILAGSWGLVFAFLLGFTGAYFSFAGTVVFPLLTQVAFGGDRDKAIETLFSPKPEKDARPTRLANLDGIIADAAARANAPVRFMSIENYGRGDAQVRTFHNPPNGRLDFVRIVYDGASGEFLHFRQNIGREESSGSVIRGLMWPLHTGQFAGVVSKSVWVGLGSAMAFVVISGLRLWVRRREEDPVWRKFGRAVTCTAYGLPVTMLITAYAYFLAVGSGANAYWWTPASFLFGIPLALAPGFLRLEEEPLRQFYRAVIAAGLILLPVTRMATGGLDWVAALSGASRGGIQGTVVSVDLLLILTGGAMLLWCRQSARSRQSRPSETTAGSVATAPAE